jgi:hypothetical protein
MESSIILTRTKEKVSTIEEEAMDNLMTNMEIGGRTGLKEKIETIGIIKGGILRRIGIKTFLS